MGQIIRDLQSDDLILVHAIEQQGQPEDPWSLAIFEGCLRVGYTARVLLIDELIVGFAILMVATGEAHLLNVAVSSSFQGQGLAKALVNDMIKLSQQQGCTRLYLEVRRSNHRAIALYERLGFLQDGIRANYYLTRVGREDALLYSLMLKTPANP